MLLAGQDCVTRVPKIDRPSSRSDVIIAYKTSFRALDEIYLDQRENLLKQLRVITTTSLELTCFEQVETGESDLYVDE